VHREVVDGVVVAMRPEIRSAVVIRPIDSGLAVADVIGYQKRPVHTRPAVVGVVPLVVDAHPCVVGPVRPMMVHTHAMFFVVSAFAVPMVAPARHRGRD
jgi:hypothetical protein